MLKCPFKRTRRHIVTGKDDWGLAIFEQYTHEGSRTVLSLCGFSSFPRDRDGQFSDVFFFGQVQKFVERSNQQLLL
jgi:hypothetical protein